MNNSKSYPAVSHLGGAVLMLTLPWAAAAQTIDDARTSTVSNSGDDATITITASGSISTRSGVNAILSTGDLATISNDGTITAAGFGVVSTGDGAMITNSGAITTTGDDTSGIWSNGPDAIIRNTGVITVGGYGLNSRGAGAMITNSGAITTTGDDTSGIWSNGPDAIIRNTGVITAEALGLNSMDAGAMVTNSGTITAGDDGIASNGANSTINNSGTITAGDDGIASNGANSTINNSGTITAGDDGIVSNGAGSEIIISGSVFTQADTAIAGAYSSSQTLTLLPGAKILGKIDLGQKKQLPLPNPDPANDVINILTNGAAPSQTYIIVTEERDITFDLGELAVRNGNTTVVIDPTGATATRRALGTTTGQIHRQVSNRLAFAPHGGDSAGDAHDGAAWGALFGSQSKRDDDGLALAFDHSFYGVVGGYDAYSDSGQRVGFFAGFGREDIKTSDIASITDTADRLFAGFYGRHVMGNWSLDGSVVVGRASHKSTRLVDDNIKGPETARGKYNSTSISPALRLSWSHALANGLELRPSAHIAYTHGFYGSYTESGTTNSNISFGKRTVGITDARLQLAVAQPFAADRGEIEWRIGATSTHYGKDSVNARLGEGETTSYTVPGDRTVSGGFVGATLHYAIKDRVTLDGTIEYTETSGDSSGALSGQLGLVFKF